MDYFTLLDVPVAIPIDQRQLNQHYQALQKKYHPDQFAHACERKQRETIQQSALINEAFQILKHPIKSVIHFLALQGVDIDNNMILRDNAFLMQQLELREQLTFIAALDDRQQSEKFLQNFIQDVQQQKNQLEETLKVQLAQLQWQQSAEIVVKLQFFDKLQQQVEQVEEEHYQF